MKVRIVKRTKKKTNKHKRQKTQRNEAEENNKDNDDGDSNHNNNDNSRANSGVGGPVDEDELSLGMVKFTFYCKLTSSHLPKKKCR